MGGGWGWVIEAGRCVCWGVGGVDANCGVKPAYCPFVINIILSVGGREGCVCVCDATREIKSAYCPFITASTGEGCVYRGGGGEGEGGRDTIGEMKPAHCPFTINYICP